MRKLEDSFTKKGFDYTLVESSDFAFIYKKQWGRHTSYEVFERRINPARVINGVEIEASEAFPYDEAFGSWAYQCSTNTGAYARFNYFNEKGAAKEVAEV